MRIRHPRFGVALGLIFAASTALAANGVDVTRGQDAMVFGNCVPSLVVENNSSEIIDYLQVDVAVTLEIWPHMIHAWPLWNARLAAGRRALASAGAFIRRHLSVTAD